MLKHIFIKNGRLHPLWRVLLYVPAYLLVVLLVQMIAFAGYGILLTATNNLTELDRLMAGQLSKEAHLIAQLANLVGVLALTWLFRHFLDRESFVSLGFRRQGPWLVDIGLGLALGLVLMALIFIAEISGGWLQVTGLVSWPTAAVTVLVYLVIFIIVGITEELSFRGYVLVNLREGFGVLIAVVVSSLVFCLAHALNPHFGPIALLNIALVGVFFCYAYLVTGNLWLPIAYHFSWNFFQGPIFSFPVSGMGGEGLFVTALTGGPEWITGGHFGPEAGLLGTAAILLSFLAVWLWARVRTRPSPRRERGRG